MPPFPRRALPLQEKYLERGVAKPRAEVDADMALAVAVAEWTRQIERLFALHGGRRP